MKGDEAYRKGKRKAGCTGAAGKLFSAAGAYGGEKRTKRDVGTEDAWYDERIKQLRDEAAGIRNSQVILSAAKSTNTPAPTSTANTSLKEEGNTDVAVGNIPSGVDNGLRLLNRMSRVIRFAEGTAGERGYNTVHWYSV